MELTRGGASRAHTIDAQLLDQELRSGRRIVMIDVRTRGEYATGHIAGARSIPLAELAGRRAELDHDRAIPIVVVSRRGTSASRGASALELAGFGEVRVLDGGVERWVELGLPVSSPAG